MFCHPAWAVTVVAHQLPGLLELGQQDAFKKQMCHPVLYKSYSHSRSAKCCYKNILIWQSQNHCQSNCNKCGECHHDFRSGQQLPSFSDDVRGHNGTDYPGTLKNNVGVKLNMQSRITPTCEE